MRIPVYDTNGKKTQEILEIEDQLFGEEVRHAVLKEAILMYEARQRLGTHDTKTRAEVAGSGRKLWRQKGTGRARVSNSRPPHWRKGGVVWGPHPRDYSYLLPKSARKTAMDSAWLAKFQDREVLVIEDFAVTEAKTQPLYELFKTLGLTEYRTLVGTVEQHDNLWRSVRNIKGVSMDIVARFSPYSLLFNHKILLTRKALEQIVTARGGTIKSLKREEVYPKKK